MSTRPRPAGDHGLVACPVSRLVCPVTSECLVAALLTGGQVGPSRLLGCQRMHSCPAPGAPLPQEVVCLYGGRRTTSRGSGVPVRRETLWKGVGARSELYAVVFLSFGQSLWPLCGSPHSLGWFLWSIEISLYLIPRGLGPDRSRLRRGHQVSLERAEFPRGEACLPRAVLVWRNDITKNMNFVTPLTPDRNTYKLYT